VTIVGDRVFSAAIYTKPHARDDWRRHSHRGDAAVIFKAEPLPDANTAVLCCRLMKKLGLRYGAFDFVETPEGEMVFLEVNSAGQHGWLEGELGLPISEAIADLLITITAT
jgi:glutathione synthase/RimK-type ligase-like ATP-grasp enzyme